MTDVAVGHTGLRVAATRGVVHVPFGSEPKALMQTAVDAGVPAEVNARNASAEVLAPQD